MTESILKKVLDKMPEYVQGRDGLINEETPIVYHEIGQVSKSHIIYGFSQDVAKTALVITYSDSQANKLYEDLKFFIGDRVLYFPTEPTLYYFVEAYSLEIVIERLKVLRALIDGEKRIVVASIEAIMKKLLPMEELRDHFYTIELGQILEIDKLQETLVDLGYERTEEVGSPSQFNIRGGIVDIYPVIDEYPYRIEFFGDEVDSIRSFDPISQRSIEKLEKVEVSPTRDLVFSQEIKKQTISAYKKKTAKQIKKFLDKGQKDLAHQLEANIDKRIEEMESGQRNNWESLLSYMDIDFKSIIDYFPEDSIVYLDQANRIKEKYEAINREFEEDFKGLLEKGEVLPGQFSIFFSYEYLTSIIADKKLCIFQTLIRRTPPFMPKKLLAFTSRSIQPFHGKLEMLADEIHHWQQKNYSIIILSKTVEKGKLLVKNLRDFNINGSFRESPNIGISQGEVVVLLGNLQEGVEYPKVKTIILNEREIFTQAKKPPKKLKKRGKRKIESFVDLNIGDYVVHENYGIGKYLGLEKIQVEGIQRDYLHIKYAKGDKLYIPTEQMDLIQPYIGGDIKSVRLNKLSGSEWKRAKSKAKKAIEDMTDELINLYAQRKTVEGYKFSKDTPWQREFEDSFPFEETPDQLQSIQEVKNDMESNIVMDRLLCGDVGYGKTEVAIRAAFKAIMDGKQVAILVPTTILAQQHYNNIVERFSDYPISIAMLSRFRTKKEIDQSIKEINKGLIDIVIGTHRIIQKDIRFKNLGLLIIDEEQRFGVSHKEKIKEWKKNIDVLSLSATPIPRTLHMSLVGIRDMSIIEQPPEERHPVQTYVLEYNEQLIRDAILRELDRDGQVYYVYNRVEDIERIAHNLQNLVPEARIAIGHGQMPETLLEKTILSFINGEYDILVSTTIIESGMDMPNVNTMIITQGDKMGLSQLYQLKGRVGRSNRLAYAYITYEKDKVLTEVAEKRLLAIKEFTEFGSGFKIAMRDLEIRGAGNLLGAEQHGHMSAIGYDLYTKLLEEAVNKAKGSPQKIKRETTIEILADAYLPKWYIQKESQRIQAYKKMVIIETMEDLYDVQEEIEDRFGDLPSSVNNLLLISYIKNLAEKIGISIINMKKGQVYIYFHQADFISMDIIGNLVKKYGERIMINASDQPYIVFKLTRLIDRQIEEIKSIIEEIRVLQEG